MTLTVAGKKKDYAEGTTIEQLIDIEKVDNPLYVTVTVNDDFAERDSFASRALQDGDVVEFLYFMGGGQ
ncbi:MAG: sulfur carrier protein ThiS [Lachnospiraceae bacterium]|nr:sulfur carrier protein ThiS [Lachnospiraceae bacterium]MBQ5430077.1 sulfur carrier protein ThiS [Lachnospiraceae bacterium]